MLLRDFKDDNRYTAEHIADIFGIKERQVYYYLKIGARVEGRKPNRRLVVERPDKLLASES